MAQSSASLIEGHPGHHDQIQSMRNIRSVFLCGKRQAPGAKAVHLAGNLVFLERGNPPLIGLEGFKLLHGLEGQHIHDGHLLLHGRGLDGVDIGNEDFLAMGQSMLDNTRGGQFPRWHGQIDADSPRIPVFGQREEFVGRDSG